MLKSYWEIAELAKEYGVSFRTLRFYESEGLLKPIRRGTLRLFTPHDRVRLELILKGKRLGFTLTEIGQLISSSADISGEPIDDVEVAAGLSVTQLENQIVLLERRLGDLKWAIDVLSKAWLKKKDMAAESVRSSV